MAWIEETNLADTTTASPSLQQRPGMCLRHCLESRKRPGKKTEPAARSPNMVAIPFVPIYASDPVEWVLNVQATLQLGSVPGVLPDRCTNHTHSLCSLRILCPGQRPVETRVIVKANFGTRVFHACLSAMTCNCMLFSPNICVY